METVKQFLVALGIQFVENGGLIEVRPNDKKELSRIFQSLRIEVNGEMDALNEMLTQTSRVIRPGGRLSVITYHSLEDRIIKQTFAKLAKGCTCPPQLPVCVCGKKPLLRKTGNIVPSKAEVEENPRSRSARLRYAIKI